MARYKTVYGDIDAALPAHCWKFRSRSAISPSVDNSVNQSPLGWAEHFAVSEAELARGEIVPASAVHDVIRAALAELERDTAESRETRAVSPNRR
jgi:hypothetical protein